jgi:hypothetical protein
MGKATGLIAFFHIWYHSCLLCHFEAVWKEINFQVPTGNDQYSSGSALGDGSSAADESRLPLGYFSSQGGQEASL